MTRSLLFSVCLLLLASCANAADVWMAMSTPCCDTVPQKKQVASVDVKRNVTTVTITYTDGTKETMTEADAIRRGLVHNDGYGNFKQAPSLNTAPYMRISGVGAKPLMVVDGQETTISFDELDPNRIASINVLKGAVAKAKYGEKGINGVVEVKLKPQQASDRTSREPVDEWQGQKLHALLGALPTDEIVGFAFSVEDENEDVHLVEQRSALNEKGRAALDKARKGSVIIFEKIRVRRNGRETDLPRAYYKP